MAIIAIDYDGTIVEDDFPNPGTIKPGAKEVINRLYDMGHHILIWTCRAGDRKDVAVDHLVSNGIKFHAVNENLPHIIELYGGDTRKMSADIYIDDRQLGGIPESWEEIENQITNQLLKKNLWHVAV